MIWSGDLRNIRYLSIGIGLCDSYLMHCFTFNAPFLSIYSCIVTTGVDKCVVNDYHDIQHIFLFAYLNWIEYLFAINLSYLKRLKLIKVSMLVIVELASISCGLLVSKNDHACDITCSIPCIVHMYNYIVNSQSAPLFIYWDFLWATHLMWHKIILL